MNIELPPPQTKVPLYKVIKQPNNQFVQLLDYIGYITSEESDYCEFNAISPIAGGSGIIPKDCLTRETSDYWQHVYWQNKSKPISPLEI